MNDKLEYTIIRNFGPSVFKVNIPLKIVEQMNTYIDNMVSDENKQKNFDHGEELVGDVTQEFKLDDEFIKKTEQYTCRNASQNLLKESNRS